MNKIRKTIIFSVILIFVVASGCNKDSDESPINLFSVEDDIDFGKSMEAEIAANPQDFPILSMTEYADAYQHINRIRDSILNTGLLYYEDKFEWNVYIIDNDTLNL